jgi:hypothetical protein
MTDNQFLRLEVLLPDKKVCDVLGHEVIHPALHQGRVHLLVIDDLPERKEKIQERTKSSESFTSGGYKEMSSIFADQ